MLRGNLKTRATRRSRLCASGISFGLGLLLDVHLAAQATPSNAPEPTPPPNLREPALSYWKAAVKGSPGAARDLAVCYRQGSNGAKQDDKQMLYWIQKAADGHDSQGEWFMGTVYMTGALGLKIDLVKSYSWMRKAAEDGDDRAQYRISECLYNGYGCPADPPAAYGPLNASGFHANPKACCALAKLFASGDEKMGVTRNLPIAYLWSRLAGTLDLEADDANSNKVVQDQIKSQLAESDIEWLENRWQEIADYQKSYDVWMMDIGAGESITLPVGGVTLQGITAHVQFAGGESQDLTIDTGTTISVISSDTARRLKLKEIGVIASLSSHVGPTLPMVEASGTVNGVPFHNLRFVVLNMSQAFPESNFEGFLGCNFIRLMRLRIDGPRDQTTLLPPAETSAAGTPLAADARSVPLHFAKGVPLTDVTVESASHETFTVPALLDTGSQQPAMMNAELDAEHPFTGLVGRTSLIHIGDIHGISYNKIGRIAGLTLGTYRLSQPLLVYRPESLYELKLGTDVFVHCVATFDYAHARLDLVPVENTGPADDPYCVIGYTAKQGPRDIRTVTVVFPGGPAEKAGLKVGDVFQSIDGHPSSYYVGKSVAEVFSAGAHTLVVRRKDKTVILKLVIPPPI